MEQAKESESTELIEKKAEQMKENAEQTMDAIRISVRNLVEFIFRSGDIDNRRTGVKEKQAMEAGNRIHRMIQRQMGAHYQSEVPLKQLVECESFQIQIEGRADGIFFEDKDTYLLKCYPDLSVSQEESEQLWMEQACDSLNVLNFQQDLPVSNGNEDSICVDLLEQSGLPEKLFVVDEIKGIYRDLQKLKKPVLVHKAQAMCYAYIYAIQTGQEVMGIQMTYCHLETEEIRRFYDVYTFKQLKQWFLDLIQRYERWAKLELTFKNQMRASLKGMEFPFPYRPGQRKLVVSVYRTIQKKAELLIQAPTGIGKTMSVLFPALKAMGEGMGERVFYLTAKTITRTVAEEAFDILRKQGLIIHTVSITAKEKICPLDVCSCNPEHCAYAKGHFDRVNEALYDMLIHEERMNRERVWHYAALHSVCPFEFQLDLALWCQGIVCDYNYVFDPNVYLRRFFSDGVQGNYIFLVDEAHNLPDRAREMYSAALAKEDVLRAQKYLKEVDEFPLLDTPDAVWAAKRAFRALRTVNRTLLERKKETQKIELMDSVQKLSNQTLRAQECISSFLEETKNPVNEEFLRFYFDLRHFNAICDLLDDTYISYCELEGSRFLVRLLCANPASKIHKCIQRGIGTIFFSATMLPMHYYRELLTTEEQIFAIYVDSPFDNRRRFLAAAKDVSSRYRMRGPIQYERVLEYIIQVVTVKTGNYMVFFPSYQYMMEIVLLYQKRWKDLENAPFELLLQEPGMKEEDRDVFLQKFGEQEKTRSLVGFCVIGGIFSEGIDLTGQKLIGALIVGTGLSQIHTEGELLREYFEKQGKDGFDYAYRFPGINKVFQAAGRVIRTAQDQGIVILLDDRMLLESHVKLFPMDWENYQEIQIETVRQQVEHFWKIV